MTVYDLIKEERAAQDKKWGGKAHDKEHMHRDWCSFIVRKLGAAQQDAEAMDYRSYQRHMVQVAALVVAELEVLHETFPDLKNKVLV